MEAVLVALTTHDAEEAAMRRAIEKIGALDVVVEEPAVIRVVDLEATALWSPSFVARVRIAGTPRTGSARRRIQTKTALRFCAEGDPV